MNRQRESRRIKLSLSCNWGGTEDCPRSGTITSLSLKGCFVQTKAAVVEGQALYMNCWLPSRRWFPLRGQIIYHLPRVGFGLMFTNLSENDSEMLNLLMDYYEGATWPGAQAEENEVD